MAINPPKADTGHEVLRAVLEAAAQFNSVTAALTRIFQTTHPSQFERDLATWRIDVSDGLNTLDQRVDALEREQRPAIALTDLAVSIATWFAKTSEKGLTHGVMFDTLQVAFPDEKVRDLQDAISELKSAGLAGYNSAIGMPIRQIWPEYATFWLFDPLVLGTSPQTDAVEIARRVLEAEDDWGHAPDLERDLGWSKRRLNPALALVVGLVRPGQVRQVIQDDYVTLGFHLGSDERVAFRQLIASAPTA